MAKVTKNAALQVAETMANEALNHKIEELNNLVSKTLTDYAVKQTPKEIMDLYNNPKTSMYFDSRVRARFCCDGLNENWNFYDLLISVPKIRDGNTHISVSKDDYEFLMEKTKEIKTLESKKISLVRKIENTLLNLGTLKRVQEEFPQAYQLLEQLIGEKKTTTISLPINDLINELNSYK